MGALNGDKDFITELYSKNKSLSLFSNNFFGLINLFVRAIYSLHIILLVRFLLGLFFFSRKNLRFFCALKIFHLLARKREGRV